MKKTILIVTHSNDHVGVANVIAQLRLMGHRPVRLDSDLYPTEVSLSLYQDSHTTDYTLVTPEHSIAGREIDAIWYRRFAPAACLVGAVDILYQDIAIKESREVMLNFLTQLDCFKVDDYWVARRAAQKEVQLSAARDAGMAIPATLISSDPREVKAFCLHHGSVVAKMLHAFSVNRNEEEFVLYTSDISSEQITDALKLCPMVFQQKIAKQRELRVTVVGQQCFCVALYSPLWAGAEIDWRRQASELIECWQTEPLPEAIEKQCIELCRKLNLQFGAIDIIVDTCGRYVFLEINPCGEFYWAEQFNGLGITSALARLLADGAASASAGKAA